MRLAAVLLLLLPLLAASRTDRGGLSMTCNESPVCCEQPFEECCEDCGEVGLGGPPEEPAAASAGRHLRTKRSGGDGAAANEAGAGRASLSSSPGALATPRKAGARRRANPTT